MKDNDCNLFSIRKVTLVTEGYNEILTVDTDNKVIFKTTNPEDSVDGENLKLIA